MPSGPRVEAYLHDACLQHVAGRGHPERPERLRAVSDALEACDLTRRLVVRDAPLATLETAGLVHTDRHLELLTQLDQEGGGRLDPDTRMGPGSLEAALRGVGAACDAVARVVAGDADAALVATRPPGHHATADRAMGFCLLNTVAVAAAHGLRSGVDRVAILDWDAHHGNGTQDIFWSDPRVLYISLHQWPFYPGSGDLTEVGDADAAGATINVPMPAGAAEDAYTAAMRRLVLPALEAFAPGLVLISAGYDAHHADPLCSMRLAAGAFHRLAAMTEPAGPGPVCVLEGGYDLAGLGWSAAATLAALLGEDVPEAVPIGEHGHLEGVPHAVDWVDRAATLHRDLRRRIEG